jgi:hypothetical protein
VCGVNENELPRVREIFGALPRVHTEGLYPVNSPTNTVHIIPNGGGPAIQCSPDINPPIPFERIRRFLNVDGVLVNMVSGFDIALETLDYIRMTVRDSGAALHLDVHNLTQDVNEKHERFRRPVETWRRWAFMVDSVQFNEEEIAGLTPEGYAEQQTVGHLLTLGVKAVLVTRGRLGATVYTDPQKTLERNDILPVQLPAGAKPVGHGDRFGAAFFYHMLSSQQPGAAAQQAIDSVAALSEARS